MSIFGNATHKMKKLQERAARTLGTKRFKALKSEDLSEDYKKFALLAKRIQTYAETMGFTALAKIARQYKIDIKNAYSDLQKNLQQCGLTNKERVETNYLIRPMDENMRKMFNNNCYEYNMRQLSEKLAEIVQQQTQNMVTIYSEVYRFMSLFYGRSNIINVTVPDARPGNQKKRKLKIEDIKESLKQYTPSSVNISELRESGVSVPSQPVHNNVPVQNANISEIINEPNEYDKFSLFAQNIKAYAMAMKFTSLANTAGKYESNIKRGCAELKNAIQKHKHKTNKSQTSKTTQNVLLYTNYIQDLAEKLATIVKENTKKMIDIFSEVYRFMSIFYDNSETLNIQLPEVTQGQKLSQPNIKEYNPSPILISEPRYIKVQKTDI